MYKYFKDNEIQGLDHRLVELLDKVREDAGIPVIITKNGGLRSVLSNSACGGVTDSSHTKGLGVDIAASTARDKFILLRSLLKIGFNRIGIYTDNHIHADIDTTRDQDVVWLG